MKYGYGWHTDDTKPNNFHSVFVKITKMIAAMNMMDDNNAELGTTLTAVYSVSEEKKNTNHSNNNNNKNNRTATKTITTITGINVGSRCNNSGQQSQ